jgi:hypothetical protein
VAGANIDELAQLKGISQEKAKKLVESAFQYLKTKEAEEETKEEAKDNGELEENVADGEG